MKRFVRLDLYALTQAIHRNGGQALGYGVLLGPRTFLGVVRVGPRMHPVRKHRLSKAQRKFVEEQRRKVEEGKA